MTVATQKSARMVSTAKKWLSCTCVTASATISAAIIPARRERNALASRYAAPTAQTSASADMARAMRRMSARSAASADSATAWTARSR